MRGDIAFVGFMLTADEWQELDAQSRAQLIAVATRRGDPRPEEPRPRRFPDGTGKHEIIESIDDELDKLIELDLLDSNLLEPIDEEANAAIELELERVDRDGDIALFADSDITCDVTAQYDAIEEWLALQPCHEHTDFDEWVALPEPAVIASAPVAVPEPAEIAAVPEVYEDYADWADL
jgi:hypothetical protein